MNYMTLVGRGTDSYKNIFRPGSESLAEDSDTFCMSAFTGSTSQLKWKLWIPPGTKCLQATIYTYASPPESKVLMRMHQPPIGNSDAVTAENAAAVDLTSALGALMAGAEIPCYTPASAGAVKLSDGRVDSPVVITTGAWLYINALQVPGDKVFKLDTYLVVNKAKYLDWYANALWDEQGNPLPGQTPTPAPINEQYVRSRVQECGLIEPLRKLSKAADDEALIKAAKDSGLWTALMKFTK